MSQGRQGLGGGYAVFKSVGTALQDLALAARYHELLQASADALATPDLASLKKPFSASGAAGRAPQTSRRGD